MALLFQAARVLLPAGTFDPGGCLSVQLLQQLEDALARYSHLLADSDFTEKGNSCSSWRTRFVVRHA